MTLEWKHQVESFSFPTVDMSLIETWHWTKKIKFFRHFFFKKNQQFLQLFFSQKKFIFVEHFYNFFFAKKINFYRSCFRIFFSQKKFYFCRTFLQFFFREKIRHVLDMYSTYFCHFCRKKVFFSPRGKKSAKKVFFPPRRPGPRKMAGPRGGKKWQNVHILAPQTRNF